MEEVYVFDQPAKHHSMKKRTYFKLSLCLGSILVCLVIGEGAIRIFGRFDKNGNFFFRSRQLKPYKLPIFQTEKVINKYLSSESSFIIYDPFLGWKPRPMCISLDGLYRFNKDGVRTASIDEVISKSPDPGKLRILIFGDSYTFGEQVSFEDTWGYHLQENLKKDGVDAEVLNFGVSAYGMDQALLRWKHAGSGFHPHIVLFGLQPVDIRRNVNLFRSILCPSTQTPISKPRFVLKDGGAEIVNSPTVPPEELIGVLKDIASWDLVDHEYFLNSREYARPIWLKSKLIAFVLDSIDAMSEDPDDKGTIALSYALHEEPAQVTLRIIRDFKKDVEQHGVKFFVVLLPGKGYLKFFSRQGKTKYTDILESVKDIALIFDPTKAMLDEAERSTLDSLFIGHYSKTGNKVIADDLAQKLIEQLKDGM